jgi:succinyl-diaminopimelate desuccinylase
LGKSAHGSTPNEGVNAIHPLLQMLAKAYPDNQTLAFLANKCCDTSGSAWGINLWDSESGNLTCSLDIIRTDDNGNVTITVDIRFPVSYTCEHMQNLIETNSPSFCTLLGAHASEPLFVASDTYLVTTLMDVYNTATNQNTSPIAIGGGTYSRCLPNCVAFGPLFPGEEQTIHMPNECISLDSLKLMAELYLEAIYRLAK